MRLLRLGTVAVVAVLVAPSLAHPYERPYDPYPWCAEYWGGREGGGSNCGFLSLEQCRTTVRGIGGFCEPNPFYNPRRSQSHRRKPR
jgi:Protein of unknown function (DUF3551)